MFGFHCSVLAGEGGHPTVVELEGPKAASVMMDGKLRHIQNENHVLD